MSSDFKKDIPSDIYFLIDVCRTTSDTDDYKHPDVPGIFYFYSATHGQQAFEVQQQESDRTHSMFVNHLLKELRKRDGRKFQNVVEVVRKELVPFGRDQVPQTSLTSYFDTHCVDVSFSYNKKLLLPKAPNHEAKDKWLQEMLSANNDAYEVYQKCMSELLSPPSKPASRAQGLSGICLFVSLFVT